MDPPDAETLKTVIDLMESDVSMHAINVAQNIEDQAPKDGVVSVTADFKQWLNGQFSNGSTAPSLLNLPEKHKVLSGASMRRDQSFKLSPRTSTQNVFLIAPEIDPQIKNKIQSGIERWDFNIFELEDHLPLYTIGCYLFIEKFDWVTKFHIPKENIQAFLYKADREYSFDPSKPNIYHKSLHAADVLQSTYCILREKQVKVYVDSALDKFCLLLSAAMHDYKHKGVTNNFLVKIHDDLAIKYSDESVLERYHCYQTFDLLRNENFQIFASFSEEEYVHCRRKIIQLILATDLKLSFEIIGSFDVARHKMVEGKNVNNKSGSNDAEDSFNLKGYNKRQESIRGI
jgi:hypothetical protein